MLFIYETLINCLKDMLDDCYKNTYFKSPFFVFYFHTSLLPCIHVNWFHQKNLIISLCEEGCETARYQLN